MKGEVEFYFDVACPFAYLASQFLPPVAARNQARIIWKPVLLGGIYGLVSAPQGKAGSASDVDPPQKKRINAMDLTRTVERFKVPFKYNSKHPVKSLYAMRMLAVTPEEKREELAKKLYSLYWVEDGDVSHKPTLLKIAHSVGLNFDEGVFEDEKAKAQLRANTQEAVDRGAPGVPFFSVNGQHFWGQDRIHFVEKALGNPNPQQPRALTRPVQGKHVVTMYYDFSSPWSYIGATQIERVVKEAGPNVTLELVPILLGALFKEIGTPNVPMMAMSDAKRNYLSKDMEDWLSWWGGVPFAFPSEFPIRSVLPLRVCIVEPRAFHAIYKAAWVDDQRIADEGVLCQVLNAAGFEGETLIKAAGSQKVKDQLKANNERAVEAGVCGVPSFQVDGGEVIWGQDKFNTLQDLLAGWARKGTSLL